MVGYPNVGKSSTINALFTSKKVVVSATPGKTKHFQTLILDDIVTLCDCPGLVFPSFASTREGMICDGILPIANMRDYISPMNLLLSRVKKEVIEVSPAPCASGGPPREAKLCQGAGGVGDCVVVQWCNSVMPRGGVTERSSPGACCQCAAGGTTGGGKGTPEKL